MTNDDYLPGDSSLIFNNSTETETECEALSWPTASQPLPLSPWIF